MHYFRCQEICDKRNISYDGELKTQDLLYYLKLQLRATLYSQMPSCALTLIQEVYSAAFRLFCYEKGHFFDGTILLIFFYIFIQGILGISLRGEIWK